MNDSQFELAAIIHDLQNPLSAIVTRAQLTRRYLGCESEATSARVERWLSEIQSLAYRMTLMLDELLATTYPADTDAAMRDPAVTNLAVVLSGAAEQVEQALGQQRIHLDVPDRQIRGPWDPGKIGRAFVNVLENALKYSPDGGAVLVAVHHDGTEVVVTIRDQGIGIPAADLPRLFEPYVRGSNTGHHFPGTGMGLASARRLIESQGGSIAMTSVEGDGTTVTLTLPTAGTSVRSDSRGLASRRGAGHGD